VRSLEDVQALLDRVDERRQVIRAQAWHEGSFDAIYEEATRMKGDLAALKAALAARWEELVAGARGENEGVGGT
jgi:hypothetical protein